MNTTTFTPTPKTEAREIADLALLGCSVQTVDELNPFVVLPPGATLQPLENMLSNPLRRRGSITVNDAASFIALWGLHAAEESALYANLQGGHFVAVFNDQSRETGPAWRDHRAVFTCLPTTEWKTWQANNKKPMQQEAFAQFIEDNLLDIIEPAAADMLEISRSLEAKKKVNFASGIRLSNGQNELTYEEQISGTAAKGKLQVPEVFTLALPVFEGGPRYRVTARLRYRIADGGQLAMWYDLERPHKIVEDALKQVRTEIEEATKVVAINGAP